jgi:chaperonin GroES
MIKPLNDRLLVKRDSAKDKIGSFYIAPSHQEKPCQGTVVAIGDGAFKNGKRIPLTCKIGDRVIFSQHAGVDVKFGDKEFTLMKEEGVLGILDSSDARG